MSQPTDKTLTIDLSREPRISGWGGFDQWQLENMDSDRIDMFIHELDRLIEKYGGSFTGAT